MIDIQQLKDKLAVNESELKNLVSDSAKLDVMKQQVIQRAVEVQGTIKALTEWIRDEEAKVATPSA